MADPYNHNPFCSDDRRESRSEYAANRALADTVRNRFSKELDDADHYSDTFARGILCGIADVASDLGVNLGAENLDRWINRG